MRRTFEERSKARRISRRHIAQKIEMPGIDSGVEGGTFGVEDDRILQSGARMLRVVETGDEQTIASAPSAGANRRDVKIAGTWIARRYMSSRDGVRKPVDGNSGMRRPPVALQCRELLKQPPQRRKRHRVDLIFHGGKSIDELQRRHRQPVAAGDLDHRLRDSQCFPSALDLSLHVLGSRLRIRFRELSLARRDVGLEPRNVTIAAPADE